ncbi:MAG TPA: deiodinase family protein, partial [Gemmataceae bacterium]
AAPDFTLKSRDGKETVRLSDRIGKKPLVLVFGNVTCGPFRAIYPRVDDLAVQYKDQVDFVAVYVRESHPTDGWRMESNDDAGVTFAQPKDYAERCTLANGCNVKLKMNMPLLVDEMDDRVGHAYSGMPARLYLIDRAGKIAYKSGRGPFGFKPDELEQSIVMMLMEEQSKSVETGVRVLDDKEAWKRLPEADRGAGQPLPVWARATAEALPRTTAAMLELDYVQRVKSPLDPKLRAKMRWVAAHANGCAYTEAYAAADLLRAGASDEEIKALAGDHAALPEAERLALQFARKLTQAAYTVTDEETAQLIKLHGDKNLTAMVLLLAYANFQDRLLLTLELPLETSGPLEPLDIHFASSPVQALMRPPLPGDPKEKTALRVDDAEWRNKDFLALQKEMESQRGREPRITVPAWDDVKKNLPAGVPVPEKPVRIRWSLVCMGYQPELATAWGNCTRAFAQEAKQDRVFEETLFWVVTRSLNCFY